MMPTPLNPPSRDDLEAIALGAMKTIPAELARHVRNVVIQVRDFPERETERDMALASPFDLLGLYQGVPLDRKSIAWTAADQDRIFLYRRPILDYWCEEGGDLGRIVRHVLIHEIGHHFGLSDADMERIESG